MADVIAHLVRAQLGELGAQADAGGPAVARQGLGHETVDGEVDRLDERLRDRAGALTRGGRREEPGTHALINPRRSGPRARCA